LIWSDETYRQFGLESREMPPVYEAFEDFIHPDDRELVNSAVEQALDGKKPYSVEARMIRVDGTGWIMHAQGTVYRDEQGKAVRFIGTQHDITERVQAEQALAEKTMYLDNILRSATEYAIVTTDLDFRITYYNPLAERFFDYTAEEAIGKTVQEMYTTERVSPERFEKAVGNIRAHGEHRYRLAQERDDGTHYLDSRVSGIYDSCGELVGFALFSHDVTERVKAEQTLRENEETLKASEAYTRNIIESSLDIIISSDMERRIVGFNTAAEETFGYRRDEVIGKHVDILYADPRE
ncbi:MAG: PAS domain S-box protein, partial [Deltaproteobacteria bacterium]|nr:PAS domain S-box protein [Deltaproteobacteria bacterium]